MDGRGHWEKRSVATLGRLTTRPPWRVSQNQESEHIQDLPNHTWRAKQERSENCLGAVLMVVYGVFVTYCLCWDSLGFSVETMFLGGGGTQVSKSSKRCDLEVTLGRWVETEHPQTRVFLFGSILISLHMFKPLKLLCLSVPGVGYEALQTA